MAAAGAEVRRVSRSARFVEATAWVTAGLLVASTLAFVVLVLAPYYANGLHLQPTGAVAGGAFDPKSLPPYNWGDLNTDFGPGLLGFASLDFAVMMLLAPLAEAVLYICVAVMWRRLSRLERGALGAILLVSVFFSISAWTFYSFLLAWLLD
jgi:hypothetical protein